MNPVFKLVLEDADLVSTPYRRGVSHARFRGSPVSRRGVAMLW